jgi:hypothetical protein
MLMTYHSCSSVQHMPKQSEKYIHSTKRTHTIASSIARCETCIDMQHMSSLHLSVHDVVKTKEHAMVEDTVAAMAILQTYVIHLETSSTQPGIDVGLDTEAHVLRVIIGTKIMSCLPQVIQASQTSGSRVYRIAICPVFFTQGIDIQQSGT